MVLNGISRYFGYFELSFVRFGQSKEDFTIPSPGNAACNSVFFWFAHWNPCQNFKKSTFFHLSCPEFLKVHYHVFYHLHVRKVNLKNFKKSRIWLIFLGLVTWLEIGMNEEKNSLFGFIRSTLYHRRQEARAIKILAKTSRDSHFPLFSAQKFVKPLTILFTISYAKYGKPSLILKAMNTNRLPRTLKKIQKPIIFYIFQNWRIGKIALLDFFIWHRANITAGNKCVY